MKEKFSVTGMSCAACSAGIERTVKKLNGVSSVTVSLMGECMDVEYDENILSRKEIFTAVTELGYGISEYDENVLRERKAQPNTLKRRFFLSLVFLLPLMYFSMGGMINLPQPSLKVSATLQMLLALAVIIVDFKFFTSGTKALIKRAPNMDTLVALGSGVSFLYSVAFTVLVYADKAHGHVALFYESAAMILALVTLGKWLEENSKRKTGDEIEKLIKLMPNTVTIERNGKQEKIPFSEVKTGDILIVKQGEYVPVDGKIIEGNGFIDRAAITGESMPLELQAGDAVTGADIVKSGFIKVVAEKVGADTALSQIVKMVKEAGASKAPIQKIADKIAGVFVPAVTLIALLTFCIWLIATGELARAANYAISVLVISCPCSLGLATPVAVMAATGRGMSLGILYKDAETLQKAKDVNFVLLDKTATLTIGQPQVTDFECFEGDETFALGVAFAMESHSNHPIAECVRAFAGERLGSETAQEWSVENYAYETGKGASALYEQKRYVLGNRRLLDVNLQTQAKQLELDYSTQGKTAVFLASGESLLAVFALADTLKAQSSAAVAALRAKRIRVAMLTGDNENVAKAIAGQAGIDEYFAEALPKDKAETVERIRSEGKFVAMVGDGINDSPALKAADVGVAMGNGTDVAIDSADVVLSRGDLSLVATMVELSKATVRNIRQNLFWAFFYNVAAIPIAAGVFAFAGVTLNPMIGAACMSLSSLFVVTNALRLTKFGKKKEEKELDMKKTLKIEGMMCNHCVAHVTKALSSVSGVTSVEVNLKKKTAVVETSEIIENDALVAAVSEAGYEVKKIS